ncbi:hypothetical protein JG688_00008013 [Phytophthora aleatoria]|uniref:AMP-dependent synthetase/ligase domain-containing protein n=1 Tax=Phytophthora aleatoria TaxID=2496075 RepID=A0A8J5M7N9_9STRA|nr:hypothetical protein JG688_00008013 [Phytophthora aleatoria]
MSSGVYIAVYCFIMLVMLVVVGYGYWAWQGYRRAMRDALMRRHERDVERGEHMEQDNYWRAVIAGIYGTSNAEACQHISAHCEAKVVVVSDKVQLDKYLSVLDQLPALTALVVWNETDVPQDSKYRVPVYSFSEFLQLGNSVNESLVEERMTAQQPGHCCSLIYTSEAALNAHPEARAAKRSVSFLPLSHSAAQLLDIHVPLVIGSEVYFAGPDALRGGLLATLQEVRPHYFCGVPRVWEKMMGALKEKLGAAPDGLKKSLLTWAMERSGSYLEQTHGKLGTVGPPLEGTQARIDPETGEIQYTGRHVFMGYLHDEEATKKTVDENGWLYSGDIGELDEDGFLSITGRLKELIITFGGENIPPVLIENEIKAELPALSNVIVIGEKRNYLTFLCSLRVESDAATGAPTDKLDKVALAVAKEIGSDATTVSDAQSCEKFRQYISDGMARANTRAASRAQQVQKFSIIPRDFSIGGNELTPTMKVKRSVVEKMYMENIEKMYTP